MTPSARDRERAREITGVKSNNDALNIAIAQALADERERCAKIADAYERAEQESHYKIIPREIADAIRAGDATP